MYNSIALKDLFYSENKKLFIKILSLDFMENVREEISGQIVPGGSINVDGQSAIRRTCNVSFITNKININTIYWAQNSKFKLEIGVSDFINKEIAWFPQGVYVISSFNQTINANGGGCTISISGKDKMCLLNGDVGGNFTAPVELAFEINNGEKNFLLIKQIIFNLLTVFGKESVQNIIINDLDDYALEAVKYDGDKPIYLYKNKNTQMYSNQVDTSFVADNFVFLNPVSLFNNESIASVVSRKEEQDDNEQDYYVVKIEEQHLAGYKIVNLIFPGGTLEMNAGETIVAALDKIINLFTEYEYFYDTYGRFVFQKKPVYINSTWNTKNNLFFVNDQELYTFDKSKLLISFTDTPDLKNVKNDFTIWGQQETATGGKKDIHIRYAIDQKPTQYTRTDDGKTYTTEGYDWREIIYQMADDYFKNNQKGMEFYASLVKNNPEIDNATTGYEQYYTDILGFWRTICLNGTDISNSEEIAFWLDFIGDNEELKPYSVKNIGVRPKVINDNKISSIVGIEELTVIWEDNPNAQQIQQFAGKYTFMNSSNLEGQFSSYPTIKTAKNEMDKILYNNLLVQSAVNINSLPIYSLEPNMLINIVDNENNINGEYLVNKYTIPLNTSGNMQITAIRMY